MEKLTALKKTVSRPLRLLRPFSYKLVVFRFIRSCFPRPSSFPAFLIIFALLSPYLFYIKSFFLFEDFKGSIDFDFLTVTGLTFFQAGLSAFLALTFALLSSLGLLAFARKKYYFLLEALILIPALMPALILALSLVYLIEQISAFPFGLSALIFAQVLTYTGICSVAFARSLLRQSPLLSEWAYLHKAGRWLFFKSLIKTLLKKDLQTLFILIFTSLWTSLSLPLLLGGSSSYSLEFFIYEKLKEPQLWPQALLLILLQSAFVFFLCWKVFSQYSLSEEKFSPRPVYLLPKAFFIVIPLVALFFSIGGLFFLFDGSAFVKLQALQPLILKAGLNSLFLSLSVGALTLLFLIGLCFSYQNKKARRFIASFTPPGVSFIGFAFLILPFYSETAVFIKWVLGLVLLLFPWIFRFRGERSLENLSLQVETARFLGAPAGLLFKKILWPSNHSLFFLSAGIASFWACADFSYSLIVSSGHWNLSLLLYDLFSSYRFNEALWLAWLLLILSSLSFLFWFGLDRLFFKTSFFQIS